MWPDNKGASLRAARGWVGSCPRTSYGVIKRTVPSGQQRMPRICDWGVGSGVACGANRGYEEVAPWLTPKRLDCVWREIVIT